MDRRNILFILVDQWPALSFGHRGASVSTPNTDQLAAEGTVFSNAFTTCTLCSPARGAMLTGRWAHQTGMYDNVGVGYSLQEPLRSDEVTWIDAAVAAGYRVGYFGKWHLGTDGPIIRGAHRHPESFDRGSRPYDPATSPHSYARAMDRYEHQRGQLVDGHPPFWGITDAPREETTPFRLAANAEEFLAEYAAGALDQPFFLTISMAPPHFPHYLPREYADLADPESVRLPPSLHDDFSDKPHFHAAAYWPSMDTSSLDQAQWRTVIAFSQLHITLVDHAIGRILDALDAHGLADSTTVVFTSDHGDMCGAHNRFDKGPYFYDEVWRIPLIARAPEVAPARQDAFVSLLDVAETLLQWTAAPTPPDRPRHGRDLTPLIGSPNPTHWPHEAFAAYDLYNGMSFAVRAIRTETHKYVWNAQSVDELYDLEADPHEMVNLAGRSERAQVQAELSARLFDWLSDIGDNLPDRAAHLPPAGTIIATSRMGP
ncbi:MAG: sulfatase-like hydrolase/transferase [Armatimonadota bacterium]|jgi:arylsulfatase A-like enzyme